MKDAIKIKYPISKILFMNGTGTFLTYGFNTIGVYWVRRFVKLNKLELFTLM